MKVNSPFLLAAASIAVVTSGVVTTQARSAQSTSAALAPTPTVTTIARDELNVRASRSHRRIPVARSFPRITCWNGRTVVDHPGRQDCPNQPVRRVVPQVASGSPKAYALALVGPNQFSCLDPMWDRESGWNPDNVNPSSGAAGIPQMLPSTWADYGYSYWPRDYHIQVQAGLKYIRSRYGTPCSAWSFWQRNSWY